MTLNHERPDRCPWQAGFTPEFAARLKKDQKFLELKKSSQLSSGNTYEVERVLGEDMLTTSVGWANSYYLKEIPYTDEWGIHWDIKPYLTPFGKGHYTDISIHPLSDQAAISGYRAPDPTRPELYREAEKVIREYKQEYWIVGSTVTTIFETAWALRGLQQMLIDMVANEDLANTLFDIPYKYHLVAAKKLVGLGVDMLLLGDDMGAQHQMMISPAMWRKYFKPRMADFIAECKTIKRNLKVAYHSDGYIEPIIPDLIDIGLDVLNPLQPGSMDPAAIKKKYGANLCFWGSIDEQKTLPFGSPDDVAREVRTRLKTVGYAGGLILAPTHAIQLDTPLENFWAMRDAILAT